MNNQINSIIQTKVFKTHKQSERIEDCQDAYSMNEKNMRFAIADGASRSFFPFQWAQILVDYFCHDETPINKTILDSKNWIEWIGQPQALWKKKIGEKLKTTTKYYLKNRWVTRDPGVSTFVGIQFRTDQQDIIWNAMIIGDSCLFHYNQTSFNSYLIKSSDAFDSHPDYFASYARHNEYTPEFIQEKAENNDYFILASDALAKWMISFKEKRNKHFRELIHHILSIPSEEDFIKFINEIRKNEDLRLENDDVTLMIIHIHLPQKKEQNPNKIKKKENNNHHHPKTTNELMPMNKETIVHVNKKAFEQLINKIDKRTKWHSFFIRLFLFFHIVSLPVMFLIIYELSNIYFDKMEPKKPIQELHEPIQETDEQNELPFVPTDDIVKDSSINEQLKPEIPEVDTKLNNLSKQSEKVLLQKNTPLYDENGNLITHISNPISVICFPNLHETNIQKRKIQLTLWVINELSGTLYSSEDLDMIQIIKNVNARKRKSLKDEDRIMTLHKGQAYPKIAVEMDQENNQWYQVQITAYIQ